MLFLPVTSTQSQRLYRIIQRKNIWIYFLKIYINSVFCLRGTERSDYILQNSMESAKYMECVHIRTLLNYYKSDNHCKVGLMTYFVWHILFILLPCWRYSWSLVYFMYATCMYLLQWGMLSVPTSLCPTVSVFWEVCMKVNVRIRVRLRQG